MTACLALTCAAPVSEPDHLPQAVSLYLRHTATGISLRALAREQGCHASTILRQVRRLESRRDDPLVDTALARLDRVLRDTFDQPQERDTDVQQTACHRLPTSTAPDLSSVSALMGYLQHLAMDGAVLVVAAEMPKAVIIREDTTGQTQRLAVLDRDLAEDMALRDWIRCHRPGRIACYGLTAAGSAALRTHQALHADEDVPSRRGRYGQAESPISILARRRDKDGAPFLSSALVQAAERLHEDFVTAGLAEMPVAPIDEFLAAIEGRKRNGANLAAPGTSAARRRLVAVLHELGPGLGDVVLRCCCFQEGVETAEAALGWSARSGKIVLRIALHRLHLIYDRLGEQAMMIG